MLQFDKHLGNNFSSTYSCSEGQQVAVTEDEGPAGRCGRMQLLEFAWWWTTNARDMHRELLEAKQTDTMLASWTAVNKAAERRRAGGVYSLCSTRPMERRWWKKSCSWWRETAPACSQTDSIPSELTVSAVADGNLPNGPLRTLHLPGLRWRERTRAKLHVGFE